MLRFKREVRNFTDRRQLLQQQKLRAQPDFCKHDADNLERAQTDLLGKKLKKKGGKILYNQKTQGEVIEMMPSWHYNG